MWESRPEQGKDAARRNILHKVFPTGVWEAAVWFSRPSVFLEMNGTPPIAPHTSSSGKPVFLPKKSNGPAYSRMCANTRGAIHKPIAPFTMKCFLNLSLALLFTLAFSACTGSTSDDHTLLISPDGPDFVPVKPNDIQAPHGFCEFSPDGDLRVLVGNQGNVGASTTVAVEYFFGETRSANTSLIPPGVTIPVDVELPSPPGGDYGFMIRIDPNGHVLESNKANNSAEGFCIG